MIQKSTPSRIFNLGGTYTTLPNKSLALLSDAITLGMFAIFISKPKDWRINKDNVCKDLNIKPRQYTQGIKFLKSVDLCREFCVYKDGKLNGRELIVVSQPSDWDDAQNQIIEFEQDYNVKLHLIEHKKDDEALQDNAKTEGSLSSGSVKQSPLKTDPTENATTAVYSKQTTEQEKTKEAAAIGQSSQDSEFLEEVQTEPAAAASSSANALDARVEATEQDGVIAERLTANQCQYVAQLSAELNEANAALGATVEDIEALLLDPKRFSKSGRDFFRKLNTIRAQALKGNFTSPGSVHKVAAAIDEKVQAQKAKDDALDKLRAEKHSLECALRSKAAQLSSVLAESHRSAIAGIEAEIAKLNPHAVVGHGHHSTSMQKNSQLIDVPALGGSACGTDMCSSSFGSATSLSSGGAV